MPTIAGWMPTYAGVTAGLAASDFEHFFVPLFEELHRRLPWTFQKVFKVVVDFSAAQAEGFKTAYVKFVLANTQPERRSHISEEALRVGAAEMLKGRNFHSIERVTRCQLIVSRENVAEFKDLCFKMIRATNQEEAQETIHSISTRWPKVVKWLNWWVQETVARMLFACLRDGERYWLSTSNPSESFNFDMQSNIGRHLSIVEFSIAFYRYMQFYEAKYEAVKTGQLSR